MTASMLLVLRLARAIGTLSQLNPGSSLGGFFCTDAPSLGAAIDLPPRRIFTARSGACTGTGLMDSGFNVCAMSSHGQ